MVSKPVVSLAEALQQLVPRNQYITRASQYSLPDFHANVFVRMLAAKPKMDLISRRIYPSMLLNKVGITKDRKIGLVSRDVVFKGPRFWISSNPNIKIVPDICRGLMLKKFGIPGVTIEKDTQVGSRDVLLNDIKRTLEDYNESLGQEQLSDAQTSKKVVCTVTKEPMCTVTMPPNFNVQSFPELIELNIPEKIYDSRPGLHLASYIFKYLYVYK